MAKKKKKIEEMTTEGIVDIETIDEEIIQNVKPDNVKTKKNTVEKVETEKTKIKNTKRVKKSKKRVSNVKKKTSAMNGDIAKVYVPKNNRISTVGEELLKVSNVMSNEQIKKPRKFAFIVCVSVAFIFAIFILILINFSNVEGIFVANKIKDTKMTKETIQTQETTAKYIPKIEPIVIDEDLLFDEKAINKKETIIKKETTKETKATKENTKVAQQETEKVQETISASLLSKAQNMKNEQSSNSNLPMLNRILPKYDTELYSSATYYQYNIDDVREAYAQLTAYYKSAENKLWGEVSLEEKGINGRLYLNYTYMKNFIENITDLNKSQYATLVEVQTTDEPVSISFANAKDMGIYYEVPASDGKRKLNLMILKGAKVGFSQSFSLMTSLEILDLEYGTKHNPYFMVEDVVGTAPKAKDSLEGTAFRIDEMLNNAKYNRIRYDKKGYITDLFYFQKTS